jgi:hypothetical protein
MIISASSAAALRATTGKRNPHLFANEVIQSVKTRHLSFAELQLSR